MDRTGRPDARTIYRVNAWIYKESPRYIRGIAVPSGRFKKIARILGDAMHLLSLTLANINRALCFCSYKYVIILVYP
jgi:hypothetical protein